MSVARESTVAPLCGDVVLARPMLLLNGGVHMRRSRGEPMGDIVFVLVTVAFFALTAAYARGCERL
jgi:hypothetical protein